MRVSTRITAATLMAGAAALAVTGLSAPAQAQETTSTAVEVQAAPGWHHVGDYDTLTVCRQQGELWLEVDWAVRFECRDIAWSTKWALWVLTNP